MVEIGITILKYLMIKNLNGKKLWWIVTQNMFGGENFGGLRIYTERNQKIGG